MKRCPACTRVFDDDSLRFCLDDGTALVDKRAETGPPETAVLPVSPANVPTMKQAFRPDVPPVENAQWQSPGPPLTKKRSLLPWILGAVAIVFVLGVAVVSAFLVYRPRQPLVWHLTLALDSSTSDQDAAVRQTVNVIERRLDALGVNYQVSPQADGRIRVSLPKVSDPDRVKRLITEGGKLELVHVVSPSSPAPVQTYATKEEGIASLNSSGTMPSNRRVLPYVEREELGSTMSPKWVVVASPAIVNGGELRDASAVSSEGGHHINFSLNKTGAEKFGAWTGSNINEYLGVVLNDEVKSIAFIRSQIYDQGEITGGFTKQAAEDLALVLRSGALPAPVKLVAEEITK